jgi:multimeric flavodoxin WrbA
VRIRVLGICGSPRRMGNSHFLLEKALHAAEAAIPGMVKTELYSMSGRSISGCLSCGRCFHLKRCAHEDDFQEIRDKWLWADAVLYSAPVYQMGIPGQMKCFLDRLGCSMFENRKHLKAIGVIAQGADLFSGQDLVMVSLINHAVFMGCVPTAGRQYGSHLGAGGWTRLSGDKNSLRRLFESGDADAEMAVKAAEDVSRSVVHLAMVLGAGGTACYDTLKADGGFSSFLSRLDPVGNTSDVKEA